jgi:hypothetical protein
MGTGRAAWLSTVGAFISSRPISPCIPQEAPAGLDLSSMSDVVQLFYYLESKVEDVPGMYRCIIDGVETGSIPLASEEPDSLAVLLHMVRVVTSAEAFLIALPGE